MKTKTEGLFFISKKWIMCVLLAGGFGFSLPSAGMGAKEAPAAKSKITPPEEAKDISVTSLNIEGKTARLTINDALVINDVEFRGTGDINIKFPEYVSRSGRIYPQVRAVSKQSYDAIKKAISTNGLDGQTVTWDLEKDVKLAKLQKHRTRPLYFGTVSFGNAIEVEVKFQKRDGKVKILWPAKPPGDQGGRWVNQVYFARREQKEIVEKPLTEEFLKQEKELFGSIIEKEKEKETQVKKSKSNLEKLRADDEE